MKNNVLMLNFFEQNKQKMYLCLYMNTCKIRFALMLPSSSVKLCFSNLKKYYYPFKFLYVIRENFIFMCIFFF
jgi:hypothetical protein